MKFKKALILFVTFISVLFINTKTVLAVNMVKNQNSGVIIALSSDGSTDTDTDSDSDDDSDTDTDIDDDSDADIDDDSDADIDDDSDADIDSDSDIDADDDSDTDADDDSGDVTSSTSSSTKFDEDDLKSISQSSVNNEKNPSTSTGNILSAIIFSFIILGSGIYFGLKRVKKIKNIIE